MDFALRPLESVRAISGLTLPATKTNAAETPGFKDVLLQALQATSDLQAESGRLSREFSLDNPTVGLEETMLAGVKSTIAFQATLQTRNKLVQAYSEIMNMQV